MIEPAHFFTGSAQCDGSSRRSIRVDKSTYMEKRSTGSHNKGKGFQYF